jgi:hypothetical protein
VTPSRYWAEAPGLDWCVEVKPAAHGATDDHALDLEVVHEVFSGWLGPARIDYSGDFHLMLAAGSADEAARFERQIAELVDQNNLYVVARRYRRDSYGSPWEDVTPAETPPSDDQIELELAAFRERGDVELPEELAVGDRIVIRDTPYARDQGIAGSAGRVHAKAYDETLTTRPLVAYAVALDDDPHEWRLWELEPDDVEREASTETAG